MAIPAAYQGREQSYLKHLVLEQYLTSWCFKLGSRSRFHKEKLWYVDCFAGPWKSTAQNLDDTSVCIGLDALEKAGGAWRDQGGQIELGALFVEKKTSSFARLERYLKERNGSVETKALLGEFGDHVEAMDRQIGQSPAFLFVDPTGWKGAAMHFIAPLARRQKRDVLINVMTSQLHRWEKPQEQIRWLRDQLRDFFGLEEEEIPPLADEHALMEVYRKQLKAKCRVKFAADLAIPHPTKRMTHFRLVVGGHDPEVLKVFRDVEAKVVGQLAGEILDEAKRNRSGQLSLLRVEGPSREYAEEHERALEELPKTIVSALEARAGRMRFRDLWPALLETRHLRHKDVTDCLAEMRDVIELEGLPPRKRTPQDTTVLRLKTHASETRAGAPEPRGDSSGEPW